MGDNFVVFRPIRGQVALELANKFTNQILASVRIRVGNSGTLTERARTELLDAATGPDALAHGGRGITTALENYLVNPLGRILFRLGPDAAVRIAGISTDASGRPTLRIESP